MFLAQPHYDEEVHEPYLGFSESANLTPEELLNLTIIERNNLEESSTYNQDLYVLYHFIQM